MQNKQWLADKLDHACAKRYMLRVTCAEKRTTTIVLVPVIADRNKIYGNNILPRIKIRLYCNNFNILTILMVRLMSDRRYYARISPTSDPTNDSIGSGNYRDSTTQNLMLSTISYLPSDVITRAHLFLLVNKSYFIYCG